MTTPTPAPIPFIIHTDADEPHFLALKPVLEKIAVLPDSHSLQWNTSSEAPEQWDVAIVRSWSSALLSPHAADLLPALEKAYPPHKADFFIPVSSLADNGRLTALPLNHIPDFLFARNQPGWNLRFNEEVFRSELAGGARLGLPRNPGGERLQQQLALPEDQVVWMDFSDPANPFLSGEIDFAIGPRGWLLIKQVPNLAVVSIVQLQLNATVPDNGYRLLVSSDCKLPEVADAMLRELVLEGQSTLVGIADGFPIRRSIYASPRFQAPQYALFRSAFEETLNHLTPPPAEENKN